VTLPMGSDPRTGTEEALLAGAASADLTAVQSRDTQSASEHPPGRTELSRADSMLTSGGARREPQMEGQ
jgi:hypothetical protein